MMHSARRSSITSIYMIELDIGFNIEQCLIAKSPTHSSPDRWGLIGRPIPWNGSPVKKYTSSTAENVNYCPLTMKQCKSVLHIAIKY